MSALLPGGVWYLGRVDTLVLRSSLRIVGIVTPSNLVLKSIQTATPVGCVSNPKHEDLEPFLVMLLRCLTISILMSIPV
jgi:hypothetical protein